MSEDSFSQQGISREGSILRVIRELIGTIRASSYDPAQVDTAIQNLDDLQHELLGDVAFPIHMQFQDGDQDRTSMLESQLNDVRGDRSLGSPPVQFTVRVSLIPLDARNVTLRRRIARVSTRAVTDSTAHDMDACAICLDGFQGGQEVTRPSCGHAFHASCLSQWMLQTLSCPLCRHEMSLASETSSVSTDAPSTLTDQFGSDDTSSSQTEDWLIIMNNGSNSVRYSDLSEEVQSVRTSGNIIIRHSTPSDEELVRQSGEDDNFSEFSDYYNDFHVTSDFDLDSN